MSRLQSAFCGTVVAFLATVSASDEPYSIPPAELASAIKQGVQLASESEAVTIAALARCKKVENPTTLIAEGDSWFDYPDENVLSILKCEHAYHIESTARNGKTLERITYNRADRKALVDTFQELADRKIMPKAVLISAGGNDIVGPELAMLLNHELSTLDELDAVMVERVFATRLRTEMLHLLTQVDCHSSKYFGRKLPILIHGYDFPVPDGRGYKKFLYTWSGPWIKPYLDLKAADPSDAITESDLQIAATLINKFNDVLKSISGTGEFSHVRYIDVRNTLNRDLEESSEKYYRKHWDNELHPKDPGFRLVAALFADQLTKVPPAPLPARNCSA